MTHPCLPLDSPRWDALEHAYGSGSDIPRWIAAIEAGEIFLECPDTLSREVVTETLGKVEVAYPKLEPRLLSDILWGALCHQYSTYSGTVAAVPHFVRIARDASPPLRHELLAFAGLTWACGAVEIPDLYPAYGQALLEAQEQILTVLPTTDAEAAVVDLIVSFTGAAGCYQLSLELAELRGEDARVVCPKCEFETELLWNGSVYRRFTGFEGNAFQLVTEPFAFELASAPPGWNKKHYPFDKALTWLPELAMSASKPNLAKRLCLHIYGELRCPGCARMVIPGDRWRQFACQPFPL